MELPGTLPGAFSKKTSVSWEGQPNALLEAMSEEVPCISTDFTGGAAQDLLERTTAGMVVPVGDTTAIAGALSTLLSDETLRSTLGSRGLEVVSQFSVDRVTQRWIDLLDLD